MQSNFHSNQILYVKGIGYARLAIDRQKDPKNNDATKLVQNTNLNNPIPQENDENCDGVLFDPEMFKIDSDSPFAESPIQINLSDINTRKKSIEVMRRQSSQVKNRQLIIVPLKLEQSNAMIYCPEPLLMKKITIIVKSLLQNCRKEVQLPIEITKTIDNFKNVLFKELGQEIVYYSDIRIYATAPRMQELNIGSKTIWQYQLKDRCKITLTAKFNFAFKPLPKKIQESYVLSNGNTTLASVQKKVETATNTTNTTNTPTVTIVPVTSTSTSTQEPKKSEQQPIPITQSPTQPKTPVQQTQKPTQLQQRQKSPQKQKKPIELVSLHLQGNAKIRSGIHYWEVKIDKLSQNKDQNLLLIGICLKTEDSSKTNDYIKLWAFDPLRCKKVDLSDQKKLKIAQKDDKQPNGSDESDDEYGCFVKNGDVVGVLLIIKQKRASLIFYKNSICLEECYEFGTQKLKEKGKTNSTYLCPFISVRGQIQVTLDSKAVAPLDSYRFK